jgi:hypothetical protein
MKPMTLRGEAIAAAVVTTLKTAVVADDCIFTALSVMAMDVDNTIATIIEIGVFDGSSLTPIDATPGPFPASTSMTIYWPCLVQAGQGIYAKFVTPTAGDRVRVVAHGYSNRIEPSCFHEQG